MHNREVSPKVITVTARNLRKMTQDMTSEYQKQVMDAFSERRNQRRQQRQDESIQTVRETNVSKYEENNCTASDCPPRSTFVGKSFGNQLKLATKSRASSAGAQTVNQSESVGRIRTSQSRERDQREIESSTVSERPPKAPSSNKTTMRSKSFGKYRSESICAQRISRRELRDKNQESGSIERIGLKLEQAEKTKSEPRKSEKVGESSHHSGNSRSYNTSLVEPNSNSIRSSLGSKKVGSSSKSTTQTCRKTCTVTSDLDDICNTLRSHVAKAQTNLLYSILVGST